MLILELNKFSRHGFKQPLAIMKGKERVAVYEHDSPVVAYYLGFFFIVAL